jgi:hypothetical protein
MGQAQQGHGLFLFSLQPNRGCPEQKPHLAGKSYTPTKSVYTDRRTPSPEHGQAHISLWFFHFLLDFCGFSFEFPFLFSFSVFIFLSFYFSVQNYFQKNPI